ncbi:MAG: nitroreductase family protein [Candidatus Lokiarchaeota archaeon]|nr:nitroreductase family protein [Candidatus Lokiarchaeota archaeon]
MDIEEAIYKRRTIRRFKQNPIPSEILKKLIDYARIAPAGSNIQAVEYIIVESSAMREKMFPLVRWASSLPKEERTPEKGREPTAYIVVLVNMDIKKSYYDYDIGAAVENILLGAVSFGIGCCWMGNINGAKIRSLLEVPENYEIKHVVSLGYPDETSKMEPYEDSFKYWKEGNKMHVPKRKLDNVILKVL